MKSKKEQIKYWLLSGLVAFILIASGLGKLSGSLGTPELIEGLGGVANVQLLGIFEIVIALIWLIRRTAVVGTLFAMIYFGGAMAVHFVRHEPVLTPLILQIIIWVTAAFRTPELTLRLLNKNAE